MALRNFGNIGESFESGKYHYQYVTKATTPTPATAGFFVDMNQTSGQPKYNAFAGTQGSFTPLVGSGNGGVYTGPQPQAGSTKHLVRWQGVNVNSGANTTPPDTVLLCDYLGFIPLIDCDDVDLQEFDNTEVLPRYQDAEGVRVVFVVQAPMLNTASIVVNYTNSQGVSGRSVTFNLIAGLNIGVCATGTGTTGGAAQATPFLPLASGDTGVMRIDSVQMLAGAGGFICACLVKPIDLLQLYEIGVPAEKMYGFEKQMPPQIQDGAYLNFLIQRSGTGAGSFRSELIFINS
jgi:hypothetical protein